MLRTILNPSFYLARDQVRGEYTAQAKCHRAGTRSIVQLELVGL